MYEYEETEYEKTIDYISNPNNAPLNKLLERNKKVSVVMFAHTKGSCPVNWLPDKSRKSREDNFEKEIGSSPEKLFEAKFNVRKTESLLRSRSEPMVPLKRFDDISIRLRSV